MIDKANWDGIHASPGAILHSAWNHFKKNTLPKDFQWQLVFAPLQNTAGDREYLRVVFVLVLGKVWFRIRAVAGASWFCVSNRPVP